MRVLITGAAGILGRALAEALAGEHALRLVDNVPVEAPPRGDAWQGDLLERDDCWRAVRGMDAVIHAGAPPHVETGGDGLAREQALLDLATRGTHQLCSAAVEAGGRRIVHAGTLRLFDAYPPDRYISERWKPMPAADMEVAAAYLAELTCREFARAHRVTVTCLRLGRLARLEDEPGAAADPLWLDPRDAAPGFAGALRLDRADAVVWTQRWGVYHLAADGPNPRFLIDQARALGFAPQRGVAAAEGGGGGG